VEIVRPRKRLPWKDIPDNETDESGGYGAKVSYMVKRIGSDERFSLKMLIPVKADDRMTVKCGTYDSMDAAKLKAEEIEGILEG